MLSGRGRRLGLAVVGAAAALAVSAPIATAANVILDGGFELAVPSAANDNVLDSPAWMEADSAFGSPICSTATCPTTGGTPARPSGGRQWAWFGGAEGKGKQTSSLAQTFQLAGAGTGTLSFRLQNHIFEEPTGKLTASVDGSVVFTLDRTNAARYTKGYYTVTVPTPALAAGSHMVRFDYSELGTGFNNLLVDTVGLDFVPSNAFTLGDVERNRKKGTATIAVTVPGQGTLAVAGNAVKAATVTASAPGEVALTVKPTGKARKRLVRSGKARVEVTISFTPVGGTAAAQPRTVKLKGKR